MPVASVTRPVAAAALRAGLAFAGKADAGAVFDAGGNSDFQGFFLAHAPAAAAGFAGIFNHLARTVTGRTGAFDREETLLRTHLTAALTCAAGRRVRSLGCARPVAVVAGNSGGHADIGFASGESVFQANLHVVTEIRATGRARAPASLC